jgi:chitinase
MVVFLAASLFPRQISFGKKNGNFKVMGYFTESSYLNDPIDKAVQFDGLTHLIYGFLMPASERLSLSDRPARKIKGTG